MSAVFIPDGRDRFLYKTGGRTTLIMRRFCFVVALALAILASPAPAISGLAMGAGGHPWDNKRVYYLIEYQGRLREKGYFVRRPGSFQKTPCVIYDEEKISTADLNGLPVSRSFKTKTITTPQGYALFRQEEAVLGDSGSETVTVANGEADIKAYGYFGGPARVPVPDGVLFEISGEWLATNSLQSGRSVTVDVLDRELREVVQETVRVGSRLDNQTGSGPAIWAAEFQTSGHPPLAAMFTSDGRLLRLESEGLIYQVVSREEYEEGRMRPRDPYLYAAEAVRTGQPALTGATLPAMPIGAVIPAWDNFAWLVLTAGPPGQWESQIGNSPYSQIDIVGGQTTLTALRNAPRVDVSAALPMAVPADIQPFLASHPMVPSQDAAVIQNARTAVADVDSRRQETNALKAVSYLAGWINQEIVHAAVLDLETTPTEVLRNRQGGSAGHARLFAAMARSLGIPARVCQGFLVQTGQAVYHVWAEAWINGEWVPVDTTVSRVGLPAGYVLAERSGPDCRLSPEFPAFLSNPVLTLAMRSAGRETPLGALAELTVGDRRTYAAYEGDWLANLYWGFALRLPAGWNGRAKLNSVEIVSPDRRANVKCEALEGEFRAGQTELDNNIANLRNNLQQFRLVDSRLVSFDTEGATPALFMDFVCQQNEIQLRCRQYVLPRRQRAFRISFWGPADNFDAYAPYFDSILASFEF